jgi:hypothetical protein
MVLNARPLTEVVGELLCHKRETTRPKKRYNRFNKSNKFLFAALDCGLYEWNC